MKPSRQRTFHLPGFLALCLLANPAALLADLNTGLVAWYPFDGNASDMSGNNNHGTVNGATLGADRHGVASKAYSFDGTDDFIDVGDFEWGGSLTISAWAKYDAFNSWSRIIDFGHGTGTHTDNIILANVESNSTAEFCFFLGQASNKVQLLPNSFWQIGQWTHAVATVEANGEMKLYRSGTLMGTQTAASLPRIVTRTHQFIGKSNWNTNNFIDGSIDDVRIYDRALSAAEVVQLYALENTDPNSDADNDGFTYAQEIAAGTDPDSNTSIPPPTFTPLFVEGSPSHPTGYGSTGFTSTTDDPLGPFFGSAVSFKGTDFGAGELIAKYKLTFDEPVTIQSIALTGAAWQNFKIRLLDENGALIGELTGSEGNVHRVKTLALGEFEATGQVFYLEDRNIVTVWRYRENIEVTAERLGPDTDGDGLSDTHETHLGTNSSHSDSDNDGFTDGEEDSGGSDPNDASSTPLTQGLVAYYPFDGNASDMSGNGHNGTVNGATLGTDRHGVTGKAYNFDGVDDHITVPHASQLDGMSSGLTLAVWINQTTSSGQRGILSKFTHSSGGNDPYSLRTSGGNPWFQSAGWSRTSSPTSIPSSIWNHLVLRWDPSNVKFFLNGVEKDSAASGSLTTISSTNHPLFIGSLANSSNITSSFFNGSIDDVRIYDRALSAAEVAQLYALEALLNQAPVFTESTTFTTAENNATGTFQVLATDPDGDTLTYSKSGPDAAKFDLNATSGVFHFVNTPDYEANASAADNNTFSLIVTATDGEANATLAVTINVTDVYEAPPNQPPVFAEANATFTTAENNASASFIIGATDPDANATLVYSASGPDAAKFTLNAITGELAFLTPPDYEANASASGNNAYQVTITVSDGTVSATQGVTVNILNDPSDDPVNPSPNPPDDGNNTNPTNDGNASDPDPYPPPTLFRPLPKTLAREELGNGNFRLWGQVLADGGSPVTGVAFELADNMVFRNSTLHSASMLAGSPSFFGELTLEPGKRYYYRAVATNAVGTTFGSPKRLITPPSQARWWTNAPEISGGWRNSPWLGAFRPYDNGWIYHAKLGWAYAHPDGSGGLWLWFRDHHWMWTRSGVFPYLWKHDLGSWHYLLGTRDGQPVFYEWTESTKKR